MVYSKLYSLRAELELARELAAMATSVEAYDAAKRKVAYLRVLIERYDPTAVRDPLAW